VTTKILIDCDPGHDDAVAILFAARHLDLKAITTVHGNNTLKNTTANALKVLELAGIDYPVAAGADRPLVQGGNPVASLHGRTGLDGADLPAPTRRPLKEHAVEVIIETARAHKEELVVAIVGPQTNIALALRREPRLAKWVREFSVMGGSATLGNVTPAAEFNISCDPEAAATVFESGVPIRMAGYNMTRVTGFDAADIERMRAAQRKTATAFAGLMEFYLAKQKSAYDLDVAPMHDVCAIVPYVAPDLIRYLHTSVRVELAGKWTRGMTVCDLRNVQRNHGSGMSSALSPNAHVAIESKARKLINLVLDTLLTYP
jgi:inosine-uridine nucleoside N-ribohydrolase